MIEDETGEHEEPEIASRDEVRAAMDLEEEEPAAEPKVEEPDKLGKLSEEFAGFKARTEKDLESANERAARLEQENIQLRALSREKVDAPAPKTRVSKLPDEATLEAGLKEDPARTIRGLIDTLRDELREEFKEETEKSSGQTKAQLEASQRRAQAVQDDRSAVLKEYGDWDDDSPFWKETNTEFQVRLKSRGFYPGILKDAADSVFARQTREGKLDPKTFGKKAAPKGEGLEEIIRTPKRTDTAGSNGGRGSGVKNPKTFEELRSAYGLTESDVRMQRRVCKDMGLDESKFVANYVAEKRANSRYGE